MVVNFQGISNSDDPNSDDENSAPPIKQEESEAGENSEEWTEVNMDEESPSSRLVNLIWDITVNFLFIYKYCLAFCLGPST